MVEGDLTYDVAGRALCKFLCDPSLEPCLSIQADLGGDCRRWLKNSYFSMPLNELRLATFTVDSSGFKALQGVGLDTSRPAVHGENVLLTET